MSHDSAQQHTQPIGVKRPLDQTKVGGPRQSSRACLHDDVIANIADGKYQGDDDEYWQQSPELGARGQVDTSPLTQGHANPRRFNHLLDIVQAHACCYGAPH